MPTFNDLYYTDMGNSALKPESATQYNVGFTYAVAPRRDSSRDSIPVWMPITIW